MNWGGRSELGRNECGKTEKWEKEKTDEKQQVSSKEQIRETYGFGAENDGRELPSPVGHCTTPRIFRHDEIRIHSSVSQNQKAQSPSNKKSWTPYFLSKVIPKTQDILMMHSLQLSSDKDRWRSEYWAHWQRLRLWQGDNREYLELQPNCHYIWKTMSCRRKGR